MPFTRSMVRVKVPVTSGLASLLKPMCVSLICTNSGFPSAGAGCLFAAASARSMGVNTPPESANRVPAPPYARHFSASRRVGNLLSVDMVVSLSGPPRRRLRTMAFYSPAIRSIALVAGARLLQQTCEGTEFVPSGIRDGAVVQIPDLPEHHPIAVARRLRRQPALISRPTEYVDDVRTMLIDHHGRALMSEIIRAAADQRVALGGIIGDDGRNIRMAREPGLHGVLIRGCHIDEVRRHQRPDVGGYQVLE